MTLRKWFHLFWTTLLLGALLGLIAGLALQMTDQDYDFPGMKVASFDAVRMVLGGAVISVISQMGLFSYLVIRYIAGGIIRRKTMMDLLQLAIILLTLFELVYARHTFFSDPSSVWEYSILPLIIFLVSLMVVYFKVRITDLDALIPTLFFMIVVTTIEAIPAIKLNNPASTIFMLSPLLACNSWQILILSKVVGIPQTAVKEQPQQNDKRKKA